MLTILCAVIGIFSVSLLPNLPSTGTFCFLIAVLIALIGYWFFVSAYQRYLRYTLILVISFLLGLSYSFIHAKLLLDKQLAIDLDNKTFVVEGVINSLIKRTASSIRFDFTVKHLYAEDNNKRLLKIASNNYKKMRLSYYTNVNPIKGDVVNNLHTGDYWQFKVKLRRPRGFVNPSGFDYQAYLLAQGLSATGYIKSSQHNKKFTNYCKGFFSISTNINCLRRDLNHFLDDNFSHSNTLGILKGLLTGDKQFITIKQWNTLKNTGTIHLLAISGLHIGLAASIGLLLGKLLRRIFQLVVGNGFFRVFKIIQIDRYIPPAVSTLFALLYSLLAGFSLPTQRALIMLLTFYCGLLFYRKSRPWFLWCVALLLTALLNPLAIYQQGFWLSFIAVAILILVFNGYESYKKITNVKYMRFIFLDKCRHFLLGFSKAQWAITIGLLLPSLLLLNGVSGLGFIANFIAIPFVSLITVPLILVGFLLLPIVSSLSVIIFSMADYSINLLFIVLEYIEQLGVQFLSFHFVGNPLVVLLVAILGVCYFLLPRGIPSKWLGLLCLLPLFLNTFIPETLLQKKPPRLKVTVFDVGQGTAIVVETAKHTLIYDAGKRYSYAFDVGEHILSPYLLHKHRGDIDMLMISHNDADHAGGVNGLLKMLKIKTIYAGEGTKNKHINARQCQTGQQWQWDNVDFKVVWPSSAAVKAQSSLLVKSNNLSCVLLITHESGSILLAGDIEARVEKELIDTGLVPEGVTLLLAPHHGSRTSSHSGWINHVQAKYVVFSAGYKNAYRHPNPTVVRGYRLAEASTFNTANDGAIIFTVNDSKAFIHTSRELQQRYWYD